MSKNFKITRPNETHYYVWRRTVTTPTDYAQFILAWMFTICTLSIGLLLYRLFEQLLCEGLGLPNIRDWLNGSSWKHVASFADLESSIEYVEKIKAYENEIYYL